MHFGAREVLVTDAVKEAVGALEADGARGVDLDTLLCEADIVVAATGRPNLIRPEQVRRGQVIFALSNPAPEIQPETALQAGAAFAADGRSINNALAYPGLFRGALDARSSTIGLPMFVAAAQAIADLAPMGQLVPDPLDRRVHEAVAASTMRVAHELGWAGKARL
jgi:malate dehydrogenase (oxaloacetate-decarboxylating)